MKHTYFKLKSETMYSVQVAMKVLSEKMNVLGLDLSKYSKTQLATATSDGINQKYKKVCCYISCLTYIMIGQISQI